MDSPEKQNAMRGTLNPLLWWGIAVTAFAALFIVIMPTIVTTLFEWQNNNTPDGQAVLLFLGIVAQIVSALLPPLGAALMAAGLVVRHLEGGPHKAAEHETADAPTHTG